MSNLRIEHEIILVETKKFEVLKLISYYVFEENIDEIVDTRFYITPYKPPRPETIQSKINFNKNNNSNYFY